MVCLLLAAQFVLRGARGDGKSGQADQGIHHVMPG
jgi:hypothetical protein